MPGRIEHQRRGEIGVGRTAMGGLRKRGLHDVTFLWTSRGRGECLPSPTVSTRWAVKKRNETHQGIYVAKTTRSKSERAAALLIGNMRGCSTGSTRKLGT